MSSAEDWQSFHENLGDALVQYAELAEDEGVEALCLGLEYRHSTSGFPRAWRTIIKRVREKFHGEITYSANWYKEYAEISFWEDLDFIGIGAYFPVASTANALREDMRQSWLPILAKLKGISQMAGRKIVFTELGYPAFDQAGWKPWEWTTHEGKKVDESHQADCYRAFFDVIENQDWFAGYFIWRYHTDTRFIQDWEYCPQGREAEEVIKQAIAKKKN